MDKLLIHEQEEIRDILGKRITEYRRDELCREIKEAQVEFTAGKGIPGNPDEIIDDILSRAMG